MRALALAFNLLALAAIAGLAVMAGRFHGGHLFAVLPFAAGAAALYVERPIWFRPVALQPVFFLAIGSVVYLGFAVFKSEDYGGWLDVLLALGSLAVSVVTMYVINEVAPRSGRSRSVPDSTRRRSPAMADLLKSQYEALPYPRRDPLDERHRLVMPHLDRLVSINHFVFGGDFHRSRPFRALVAGGGTGDAAVALACQLRVAGIPGEVVYLDLSEASREIACARAAVRGLDNVRFEAGSLLEPGRFAPGSFDYVNCSGVLHHLESPLEGLRALARLLGPEGGIGLMLYGALGRTGVYPAQELLRTLAPETLPGSERLRLARRLLASLPATNWLRRNPATSEGTPDDAELFDLLLHSRDRAYSVEEAVALAAAANMRVVSFIPPAVYRPAYWLKDGELIERFSALDPLAQAACAEKLSGCFAKHEFYVVHATNPVSSPDFRDPDSIPMLDGFPEIPSEEGLVEFSVMEGSVKQAVKLREPALRLLRLIDGVRSLGDIYRLADLGDHDFKDVWSELYALMHGHGYLHLSRKPMPKLQFSSPSVQ